MTLQVPTIHDVALLAGVSVGTVSNVLNRPEQVHPDTRDRVTTAIAELQYTPNEAARALRAHARNDRTPE
jgi:LacI family transcriptional regulator